MAFTVNNTLWISTRNGRVSHNRTTDYLGLSRSLAARAFCYARRATRDDEKAEKAGGDQDEDFRVSHPK
jgi:hypothetical protein